MFHGHHACAVIAAGGVGRRMGASVPKQFLKENGRTILEQTVRTFRESGIFDRILITIPEEYEEKARNLFPDPDKILLLPGGKERQDSVFQALKRLKEAGLEEEAVVAVHDGVRPFASESLIFRTMERADECGAAIAAVPARYTIRHETEGTLERKRLYEVQTPQAFRFGMLYQAFERAERDGFHGTDEAGLVERLGILPEIVPGEYGNLKITVKEDLPKEMRIGHGFDVHAFAENRKLILGGVEIPYEKGLLGHSDADVLLHALMDAMLGAAALGDIGKLFPDTDPAYEGISSLELLRRTNDAVKEAGYCLGNADVTVICQRPKLAGYIQEMRENIASACGTEVSRISVKATTTEKLGFTGRGEGIAAEAVCALLQEGI